MMDQKATHASNEALSKCKSKGSGGKHHQLRSFHSCKSWTKRSKVHRRPWRRRSRAHSCSSDGLVVEEVQIIPQERIKEREQTLHASRLRAVEEAVKEVQIVPQKTHLKERGCGYPGATEHRGNH